jgi:hypothetical protein
LSPRSLSLSCAHQTKPRNKHGVRTRTTHSHAPPSPDTTAPHTCQVAEV